MGWPSYLSGYRRWLILSCHTLLLAFLYFFSFLLRFDFALERQYQTLFWQTLSFVLVIKIAAFSLTGLFRGWWRYAGIEDLQDIVRAAAASSLLVYVVVMLLLGAKGFPRSVIPIDLALTICALGGLRLAVRVYQETSGRNVPRKNTLIVGAGEAGNKIARELKASPELDLNPVGFVDDDRSKQGIKIHGIRVLGQIADLHHLATENRIDCILLAVPSANGSLLRRVVEQCAKCRVELKILPAIKERLNGKPVLSKVRSVRVEDLLGRPPVVLDLGMIRRKLTGKVLMITGAGGSIGSELARQLASFQPRKLVLFERAENELHAIELELRALYPELDHVPIVGDILDVRTLRDVMTEYRPNSIFHAAAYKHVPMMEKNCFQAVVNNIFGTYNVALVSKQCDVGDVLMISSDKAVNPTNIMGVTKRVAELVILSLQSQHTRFVAVRFGNVLGSNGSVLQLFQQQLAGGGPLTITHPDCRRYFMTIPEAVELVLQASTMGRGGEIFVLEMGNPVKIVDLARNLVQLSGLTPERDIQFVYTGLRPGEKLFEELRLDGEGIKPTSHDKIRVLDGGPVDFATVERWLEELSTLVDTKNAYGLVTKLQAIVPEYTASPELLSLCRLDRHDLFSGYKRARMELFRTSALEPSPTLQSPNAA